MIDKRIVFDERYDSDDYETTTLYFSAPKGYLKQFVPNKGYASAEHMEISIEFPLGNFDAKNGNVMVSPTIKVDGGYSDYDWNDVDMPYETINELVELYMRSERR